MAVGFLDLGDVAANSCLPSCDNTPGNMSGFVANGDYSSSEAVTFENKVCCLKSSIPYLYTGFGIASLVPGTNPLTVAMASFVSLAVIDFLLLLLLIVLCAAIGLWFLDTLLPGRLHKLRGQVEERRRLAQGGKPGDGQPPRARAKTVVHIADACYWAITTLSTVGYGDVTPNSAPAKVFTSFYLALCMGCSALFSAILSASVTTGLLAGAGLTDMAAISGAVCLEWNYAQLVNFIEASPSRPSPIMAQPLGACMDMLRNGTVQAVITTQESLSYYNRVFGWSGLYVSQVLPFSAGSYSIYFRPSMPQQLVTHVNALIIAVQQIYPYNSLFNALQVQYATTAATGGSGDGSGSGITRDLIIAIAVLAAFGVAQTAYTLLGRRLRAKKGGAAQIPEGEFGEEEAATPRGEMLKRTASN